MTLNYSPVPAEGGLMGCSFSLCRCRWDLGTFWISVAMSKLKVLQKNILINLMPKPVS